MGIADFMGRMGVEVWGNWCKRFISFVRCIKINCVSKVNILFISLADTVQITASRKKGGCSHRTSSF